MFRLFKGNDTNVEGVHINHMNAISVKGIKQRLGYMVSMIAIVLLASCKNSNQQNLTGMIGSEEDLIAEKTDRIDCIDNNTRELLLNPQENLRIKTLITIN